MYFFFVPNVWKYVIGTIFSWWLFPTYNMLFQNEHNNYHTISFCLGHQVCTSLDWYRTQTQFPNVLFLNLNNVKHGFQMVEPATGELVIVCNEGHQVNQMSWGVSIVFFHFVTENFACPRKTFVLNAFIKPNPFTGCRNWRITAQFWRKQNWPSRIVKLPWPICTEWSPKTILMILFRTLWPLSDSRRKEDGVLWKGRLQLRLMALLWSGFSTLAFYSAVLNMHHNGLSESKLNEVHSWIAPDRQGTTPHRRMARNSIGLFNRFACRCKGWVLQQF